MTPRDACGPRAGAHRADGPPADLGRLEFPVDQAMAFFHGLLEAGTAVQASGAETIDVPALMRQVAQKQGYFPWPTPDSST